VNGSPSGGQRNLKEDTVIKRIAFLATVVALVMAFAVPAFADTGNRADNGPHARTVVYVESQGLYYDSIVLGDLPQQGPFQQLIPTEDGLVTEFGPGDPGHLGGRWWIDVNHNGVQDEGDAFFLCPLLGPGRATP
jgi:hypothetical protein